jgi:SAM-dependent methyltransferase
MSKALGAAGEAPTILSLFAAMIYALDLEPGLHLLDFGAGSCWTSRMLVQLGCHVVACDVSPTALAIGQRLFELQPPFGRGSVQFLAFDGLSITLPDGSVDRVSCMDAFHHVPNWGQVLSEFHRVLRPGGVVVLAEGGPNHSRTAQAQYEMRNFTVVERDMIVEEFSVLAESCGFIDVKVGIYSGAPVLVAASDFTEALHEGAVASSAARQFLENHRLIVMRRAGQLAQTSRRAEGLMASIVVERLGALRFSASISNVGSATWLGVDTEVGRVNLGVRLLDDRGVLHNIDFVRVALLSSPGAEVAPGDNCVVTFELPDPQLEHCRVSFDLVSEGVGWFSDLGGSTPVDVEIEAR